MSADVRKTAWVILNTLDQGRRTLDVLMNTYVGDESEISRRDRALLQTLVFGVLRWRGRLDFIISRFSNTRFNKIDPKVLNILRLALFQIIYLDRIPVSAAVTTAVDLAKSSGARWVVGYVNALLRKASREYPKMSFPDVGKDAAAALSVNKSFPRWIVDRWMNRYGLEYTAILCDAANSIPPLTVRTNTLKTSPGKLLKSLAEESGQATHTVFSPLGIALVNPRSSIPGLTAFEGGWFQVQDEAAQLVSFLLDPQPGEKILDACAGLGGKTGHIAQLMNNEGAVTALDNDERKLGRLEDEMQRLGTSIVSTVCHDLEHGVPDGESSGFDRVLLDAPCSGLGVIRRNPDIKWQKSEKNLVKNKARQLCMLENLWPAVKPGGILVYAVCTPEPEENEEVIHTFLKNHANFAINLHTGSLPEEIVNTAVSEGFLKTFPKLAQMDGFFAVRLERIPC